MADAARASAPRKLSDLDYVGAGDPLQMLDLYLPDPAPTTKRPLVVFIHGGGWRSGSKEEGLGLIKSIAGGGEYASASINYRLTQFATWPAQIFDCKAAIRFLRGNADKFGIDPDRIAVVGVSAGAHLADLLGTSGGVPDLEGALGRFHDQSSRVQCVVNFFGPTNFETFFGSGVALEKIPGSHLAASLLGKNPDEIRQNARLASPVAWITRDDAPILTAHGTHDRLVPFAQAEELDRALARAGVESHLIAVRGAGHGFISAELNRRVRTFLDQHLRGIPGTVSTAPIDIR